MTDEPIPSPSPAPEPATAPVPVDTYMAGQVNNPNLPPGTELVPIQQQVQNNELMNPNTGQVNPTGANIGAGQNVQAPTINQTQGQAAQTDPNAPLSMINPQTGQYDPNLIGNNAAQGVAAQGQVNPLGTVRGQLEALYAELQNGATPAWARGAVNAANNAMGARGLISSSIGATAIAGAIQSSAINIAAQDASTYFQMDMANLNNQQQMAMENLKNRQQALLTDQAATNAAAQFNASSQQQTEQFMASLTANINNQNADRRQAMEQFNAGQANSIAAQNAQYGFQSQTFNAQQSLAIAQFNANLQNQREQFNSQNQFAIEQSNVLWRRSVNTANNAAVNAANQFNVQNRFNISQQALNNIWQQFRDEAAWLFTASENQRNRDFNAGQAANNRNFVLNQNNPNLGAAVGAFARNLLL